MADEYISREAALRECQYDADGYVTQGIKTIPAADVVPVVRCKDCDLWNEWDHAGRESLGNFRCSCAYWTTEDGPTLFYTAPTDFCSYGERKDGDSE